MKNVLRLLAFPVLAGFIPMCAAAQTDVADLVARTARYESGSDEVSLHALERLVNDPGLGPERRDELERGLIRLLEGDSTFEARRFAALHLAVIGTANALEALGGLLKSEETAGLACFALGRIESPKSGGLLRAALPSSRGMARVQIIETLGSRAEMESVAPLAEIARCADKEAASAAVRALAAMSSPAARDELLALMRGAEQVRRDEVAAALLGVAQNRLKEGAAKEVPALCEPLLEASFPPHVRRGALGILLESDRDSGERRIVRLLDDKTTDDLLVAVAIARISCLPGKGVSKAFGKRLSKLPPARQVLLVEALAVRNDKAALEAIRTQVRAEAVEVRLEAVKALGMTGGAEVVGLLTDVLAAAGQPEEVKDIQHALASLGGGDVTDRALVETFRTADTPVKNRLFAVLSRRGGSAVVGLLLDSAYAADPEMSRSAAQALTRIADTGDTGSLEAVRLAVAAGDPRRQEAALRALAAWRGFGAWDTLHGVYGRADGAQRALALRGMVRMAGAANAAPDEALLVRYRQLMEGARSDEDRKLIVGALAGVAHPDALGLVLALLERPGVRDEAAAAVRRMAEALKERHPDDARNALARLGGGAATPFFAMDTGLRDDPSRTPAQQARLLKELGYAGVGWGPAKIPEMLAACDAEGLKMFNVYIGVEIGPTNRIVPEHILRVIEQVKGRDTALWLHVQSKAYAKPSDEAGDADAVVLLRDIADLAQQAGVTVSLYPHTWFWMERVQDAVRLARKVDRPNLGVTFNLCHCIKVGDAARVGDLLEQAKPYLTFVTVNGADHEGDWGRLIQPLGQGAFDVGAVLKNLKALGYTGAVGLQHYGIKGDAREKLGQSMRAWQALQDKQ